MVDKRVTRRLLLRPVDTLSFRDARPFGPAEQADSGLPSPQTLAGAIRTFLLKAHGVNLKQFGDLVKRYDSFDEALSEYGYPIKGLRDMKIGGPWFSMNEELLVPIPSNLKISKSRNGALTSQSIFRLDPIRTSPPGWQPREQELRPLWRYGRESLKSASGYIKPTGLRIFLEGGIPSNQDLVSEEELYAIDRRVGIAIDAKRKTVDEGMIYTAGMLALKPNVAFCVELTGNRALIAPLCQPGVLMKFGGEGKYVEISVHNHNASFWPNVLPGIGDGRLLLLTTPAWFDGWKPRNITCIAASVSHPEGVSGWDLAQGGPKPNRFMVPAGTVYFLPKNTHIPQSLVEHHDALVGWGHYLEGNWNYV
ncbi:MAG: type III-B CRISPR module-associated protein Cmr3 [Bacteroidetes bacterium]|nr:type III-B CRISPR module-associated protein Cmr3 [Bacteroidota bacterium]